MSLALESETRVGEYIAEVGLAKYTPSTITSPAAFRRELDRIRRRGYAVSNGEFLEDLMGLAVPVANPGDATTVTLVVAGPAFRIRKHLRRLIPLMQETAAAVARDAAGSPDKERSHR